MFDAQNIFALWRRWVLGGRRAASDDYTLLVPVYGHRRYFEHRENLEPYRERVLVVLDMAGHGMESLASELEAEGWAVHRARVEVPGPPALILDALDSGRVQTRFAFRMDADTYPVDDPGPFVAEMREQEVDFVSVRVYVREPRRVVEKIQALEYRMAMRGRRYRPWLSSGACYGGTTVSLRRVLSLHSLWFPGEDLEAGRIALALKLRVRHLDMCVETDAPRTWTALWRQRRSWWAGGFRHAVVNADKNLRHTPVWTFYNLGLVCLGAFLKIEHHIHAQSIDSLAYGLAVLFIVYSVLMLVTNWPVRSWWMLVYPPYALVQALAMPLVGSVYWAKDAFYQRHWGRYRFGYRRGARLRATSGAVAALRPATATGRRSARPAWSGRWAATALGALALVVVMAPPTRIATDGPTGPPPGARAPSAGQTPASPLLGPPPLGGPVAARRVVGASPVGSSPRATSDRPPGRPPPPPRDTRSGRPPTRVAGPVRTVVREPVPVSSEPGVVIAAPPDATPTVPAAQPAGPTAPDATPTVPAAQPPAASQPREPPATSAPAEPAAGGATPSDQSGQDLPPMAP